MPTATLKKEDVSDRLLTRGELVDLPNNLSHTNDPGAIDKTLRLIGRYERKLGRPVAILGEVWRSAAVFETQYCIYEAKRAAQLAGTERYSKVITKEYLQKRKQRLLALEDSL